MAGGLLYFEYVRGTAEMADKILRRTKPADISVEQPTKFDLGINPKTAKTVGLGSSCSSISAIVQWHNPDQLGRFNDVC